MAAGAALGASGLAAACTTREIVAVEAGVVTLHPGNASLLDGEPLQFTAIVTDTEGNVLSGVEVTWTTDHPEVASIDSAGMLLARGEGTTKVRGQFRGVEGTATVTVFPGPTLVLSQNEVALSAVVGAPPPPPIVLQVSVEGIGTIQAIEARTLFAPGQVGGWLSATLGATVPPTTLTLTVETTSLPPGLYDATVVVDSEWEDDEAILPVSLEVKLGGIAIAESDGSTSTTESGGVDVFTVTLESAPASDVVLAVASADETEVRVQPSELTFTPSSWSEPQAVVVEGRDDSTLDGDVLTDVSVSVVDHLSDPTYADVPSQTVQVSNLDDEEAGFSVRETRGGTRVRWWRDDEIRVELDVRPVSDVVIDVWSDHPEYVAVSPSRLTFGPDDWDDRQEVVVYLAEDHPETERDATTVHFAVNDELSHDGFDDVPDQFVTVEIDD